MKLNKGGDFKSNFTTIIPSRKFKIRGAERCSPLPGEHQFLMKTSFGTHCRVETIVNAYRRQHNKSLDISMPYLDNSEQWIGNYSTT